MPDQDKALARLDRILRDRPDDPRAHAERTALLLRRSDWRGLRSEMEWALKRLPPDQAAYDRSYLSLLFGEMPQGWDQYEVRHRIPGLVKPVRSFVQPAWSGEPFEGKTLLLHFEQGFGDTFMFLRYAPLVKARGGRVVLLAQPELADVAATCQGLDAVVPEGSPLPPFDLQLPLPSLPRVFRTDLDSIPCEIPYLDVPEKVPGREAILQRLARTEGRLRVGCAWSGSPIHRRDKERSVPPGIFARLGAIPGVDWYSFQHGAAKEAPLPGLTPLGPVLRTFSDTAYALSGMDLVITVDTALAHLAGAMGIPTLLLVHFQPDYRWLLDRPDSPWYPSLRIYRQAFPGDWNSALTQVIRDLSPEP